MKRILYLSIMLLALQACNEADRSDAYGNFEAVGVTVSAQANGQILHLDMMEGDIVNTGDTLGLIDTLDLHLKREQLNRNTGVLNARLRSIRSQLQVQEQQRKNLLVEKNRLDKLFEDGAATQKQMDDMAGNLDLLEQQMEATRVQEESIFAEMSALQAQISQINESIARCWIISPVDGTVLSKYAEKGEVTGFGKPICKLANLSVMELKVYISGDQLPYLEIGKDVQVLIDKNQEDFKVLSGKVSWISSRAEFTPKTIQTKEERVNLVYAAKVFVPNDGSLKIGMPGEINFMTEEE
jgi:HlyD family secretion protein